MEALASLTFMQKESHDRRFIGKSFNNGVNDCLNVFRGHLFIEIKLANDSTIGEAKKFDRLSGSFMPKFEANNREKWGIYFV